MQGSSQQGSEHTINATTNVAVVASSADNLLSEDREENTRREKRDSLDILEESGELLFTPDADDADAEDSEKSDKKSIKSGRSGAASSSVTGQSVSTGINAADLLSVGGAAGGVSAGQAGAVSGNNMASDEASETSGETVEEVSDSSGEESDTDNNGLAETNQDNEPESQETNRQESATSQESPSSAAESDTTSNELSPEAPVISISVPAAPVLPVSNANEPAAVINQVPSLQADYATVNRSQLTINNDGLLANDTDAESLLFLKTVNGQAVDVYGTTRISGEYGELRINRLGQWNYQPNEEDSVENDQPLTERFVYEASDGEYTVSSVFSMQLNHAPEASDLEIQLSADQPVTSISLQATDRDQDDTLLYSLDSGSDNGVVSISSAGEALFYTTDAFSEIYVGDTQTTSFSYQVTDRYGNTDTATVQLSVAGTKQPFASNLVENASASDGLNHWNILSNGGNGWAVSGAGHGDNRSFITSYQWGRKSQLIDLESRGYDAQWLDSAPLVQASEWYKGIYRSSDYYQFKIELRDENQGVIERFDTGIQTASSQWQQVSHSFENYGAGLRYIYVEHGGRDSEYWWGHYGTVIDDTTVMIEAPTYTPSSNEGIVTRGISLINSQILLQQGHTTELIVSGAIVSDGDFTSVDQWGIEHHGGDFSADILGTSLSLRLYSVDGQGYTGPELLSADPQNGMTKLNIENLPYGNYLLAVGPEGMTEAEATAALDYPFESRTENNSSVEAGEYQLTLQANAALTEFPRDPESHDAIVEQYESLPVVNMTMTLIRSEAYSDSEDHYHYVLQSGDDILFEGASFLAEGQTEQILQADINQDQWSRVVLDELSVAVYQLDDGVRGIPAVFDVLALQTADGGMNMAADIQDIGIEQLWETGFDSFDVLLSESLDDGQDSLYV